MKNVSIKMIKDPIHGFVEFEGEIEHHLKDLLSDPFFQRLRRVKQLGFSDYVFPSAAHSRFSHSLGVYAVAKRMLPIVERDASNGKWSEKGRDCLAAALLHDVGHGMFSHAFEKAMKFFFERNPHLEEECPGLRDAVDHEKVSPKIIEDSSIGEHLNRLGGDSCASSVASMIQKSDKGCIYTSIVSGQLDADRIDYAKRDPYFAGVSSGSIDIDWLIRNLRVGRNGSGEFLYVNSKAYISLEQFTVTLFQLYPTIYLHKRTRGLEYMFALLISRVFELIADGKEAQAGLTAAHPFVKFMKNPSSLENILLLDDTVFWGSLNLLQDAPDQTVAAMANRFASRKILPMLDVWKMADEVVSSGAIASALPAATRVETIDSVCGDVCLELQEDEALWGSDCYYDTYGRPIYKRKGTLGGDPQQINVEVGGQIIDIASISPLVASAASFNIHRIYYDDQNEDKEALLKSRIKDLLQTKLNGG